jgi:D-sedoheptulose 7-phosphate isomerase
MPADTDTDTDTDADADANADVDVDAVAATVDQYPDLDACREEIVAAVRTITDAYREGGTLLCCGNGGSAADADHLVGELLKSFERERPLSEPARAELTDAYPERGPALAESLQGALPAVSLSSQSVFLTAFANDVGAEAAFAQQVHAYGDSGDVLVGFSTSGTSGNVLDAMRVANVRGLHTVGLTGGDGGEFPSLCDVTVAVPRTDTAAVQELHRPVYHAICRALEGAFFG